MPISQLKEFIRESVRKLGWEIRHLPGRGPAAGAIPDAGYYDPLFSPWLGYGAFGELLRKVRPRTLVSADRLYVLWSLARQALALPGEHWECGVFRGGSARLLAEVVAAAPRARRVRLFDSFAGMRATDPGLDLHVAGDFAGTSLEEVRGFVGHRDTVTYHPGWIPETFAGLEDRAIAFAHVDVDLHQSVVDCCRFIVPRMPAGGLLVFDDYGFASCPGARRAVDDFFRERREVPLVLPTGQAIVVVAA